jgi:predicted amidophosphoribosyltransferase
VRACFDSTRCTDAELAPSCPACSGVQSRIATRKGDAIPAVTALQRIGRAAARYFLPSRCLACEIRSVEEVFRGGVCSSCWRAVAKAAGPACPVCSEPLAAEGAERCGRCLIHPPSFRSLRAAAPYRGSARSILLAFKFRGADYLGARLAEVIVERLSPDDTIVPCEVTAVPATPLSVRRRGYHPAALLAEAVAAKLRIPFSPRRLRKIRETSRQSRLTLEHRRSNVRGAFRAEGPSPKRVLLVDDVATSAWTARECAEALRAAGAEQVDVWCFARASRDDFDRDERSADSG